MKRIRRVLGLIMMLAGTPAITNAQDAEPDSADQRRALLGRGVVGFRSGVWAVEVPAGGRRSPLFELYFQRGLDEQLSMESSAGIWWVTTSSVQLGGDVETRSFVIPLLTSFKLYPMTSAADRLEPFVIAGAGFALGIEDEDENAIGGGGTSLVTGFGVQAGAGIEFELVGPLGMGALAKYQWIRFGQEVGNEDTFGGFALEAGLTFRFGSARAK